MSEWTKIRDGIVNALKVDEVTEEIKWRNSLPRYRHRPWMRQAGVGFVTPLFCPL